MSSTPEAILPAPRRPVRRPAPTDGPTRVAGIPNTTNSASKTIMPMSVSTYGPTLNLTPGPAVPMQMSSDGEMRSTSPEDSTSNRLRKVACVECRQQKVKCDAFQRDPEACTRCVKRNLPCSIKTDFKRTYKRARLAAVEKEVEELRRSLEVQNSEQDMVSRTLLDLARGNSTSGSTAVSSPATADASLPNVTSRPVMDSSVIVASGSQVVRPAAQFAPRETDESAPQKATTNGQHFLRLNGPPQEQQPQSPDKNIILPSTGLNQEPQIVASFQMIDHLPQDKSFDSNVHTITPRTLEGFTVTKDQILGLFLEFQSNYHPYLPVVDLCKGPDNIYLKSDLLFWIILETASRIYSDLALFPILSSKVKELVARQLNSPLRSAYDVQAILIFTVWPPPAGSLNSDPSWNTCGLAMFNAVKLGLHCPGKTQDFGRVKVSPMLSETQEQVKTWVTCNIVSQHLSMALGYPTFSMYDWTVNNSYRREGFISMPKDLKVQVELAKFCDRMVRLLNQDTRDICGNVDSQTRRTVIRVLAKELDEIELSLGLTSDICKLLILVTRTQLYAYAFLDENLESNLYGLTLAYQSAIQTIAFTETLDVSIIPDGKYSKLLYLPTYVELGIVLAAFIIMKLQFSSLCETLDVTSGKRHFASAIAIMRKSSIKDNDFPIRVSTIMFQLWKLHSKDKLDAIRDGRPQYISPRLKLRSRMATSVLFDSIWVWRERYGTFQTQPAGAGQGQHHPLQQHQQQAQHQQQQQPQQGQQGQQVPLSKIQSPRLHARRGPSDDPELRNARGVMALLDSTSTARGPSFEQQNLPLPPPMNSLPIPHTMIPMGTGDVQQPQNMPSMGTDELVHYLDNEAVAFDHLYLDWQEMGVLWDDITLFIGAVDDDPQSNVMEQVHDYAVGNPQAY
ncbi:hypothetical protein V1508DRAFT_462582 [Lipomyces doorenjongii]|uniref:uncharacterized protein n=1 Tax=Lipomyces doorenjongii TaxID=383834 RepID=UPI0034CD0D97